MTIFRSLCAILILLIPTAIFAQSGPAQNGVYDYSYATRASLHCQITVTTSATSLQALLTAATTAKGSGCTTIPPWVTAAWLTPESTNTYAVRWSTDNSTLSASIGEPIFGNSKEPTILGYPNILGAYLISPSGSITLDVRLGG